MSFQAGCEAMPRAESVTLSAVLSSCSSFGMALLMDFGKETLKGEISGVSIDDKLENGLSDVGEVGSGAMAVRCYGSLLI